ncbi:putative choline kinase [Clavispora lusitaniae]|uniref:Choline kinase N-terminal domain-containing protein n=3 Tax=Clavispora lusitaniae TaxID=36911 RepID=C4YAL4_CLAL4|nr:uncharacterized protein CLUG_05242 [Clavispora lusitaniae ATCC 42720]OVF07190.1 putative bifunctional choline kinase/ethanolamine kinase [Clavispora lusitaniae]EEQ41114.1 hypothetical protein CLUG_05242 [Clavispora lusitaniae ATCC 42720]QFZ30277.1 putative choline kinase [Clavispora lusitaniae]QFZ35941.1 putative choline kinase [Clavispora lusitaniae]QFZ41623.1 putative choline kinase [Clavispora lusitaniae]
MDITPAHGSRHRSRSSSRTRNSTANSRSTSASRRPSLSGSRRSLSSASLNRLVITPTAIDLLQERTVPSINVVLDNSLPLDFFKQELIGLIKALRISKWHKRQLTVSNMSVTRISGALTNSIYKIEYKDVSQQLSLPALLLRVYGKNVDSIIDRDSELQILIKLSAKKIGPKLLGIFENGRFEQFLEGFITMGKDEIRNPVISQMLGRRMKDLHYKIDLDEQDRQLEFPVAWIQIMKWMRLLETQILPSYDPKDVEDALLMPWAKFKEVVFSYREWLFAKYDTNKLYENYRFCHNDTQYGNLLLRSSFEPMDVVQGEANNLSTSNKRDRDLAVIDFEYSGVNFAAYDIADHFSEWMSDYHDADKPYFIHDDKYPSLKEQMNLLMSYIEYDFQFPTSNFITKNPVDANSDQKTIMEYEAKKLYNEVIFWRATVQIFWSIWGLIQNGPNEKRSDVDDLSSRSEEQGVNSTYSITTGLDSVNISENAIEEEAITSTDDDFDYLKYTQQKAALIAGDFISFGLLSISDIDPKYHNVIKFLDTQVLDV